TIMTSGAVVLLVPLLLVSHCYGDSKSRSLELLKKQYAKEHELFAAEMEKLAGFCEANSFFTDAERIRKRAGHSAETLAAFDNLPSAVLPPIPKNLGPVAAQWQTKLRSLDEEYARKLYLLARRAINQRHASFAFQLVRELVYHNPDHKFGRELLGFVRYEDEWTSPFSSRMRPLFVDHSEFGWIPKINVARYEQGERYFDGNWMSVEREATLRKVFRNGWEIETEHFSIKTNHSLEKGVEIGRQLEIYHRFFMREFAAFFNTPEQIQKLFGGGATSRGTQRDRHRILYFANQKDFAEALKAENQIIEIATGFYLPRKRTSYFYYDDDPEKVETSKETMFHEVTHQLLGESSRRNVDVGEHHNFWVIEGIACYMESFEIDKHGAFKIGDPKHPRIYWAKQKAIKEEFYIPMERYFLFGKKEFQAAPNNEVLHAYYSQSTGLVHFFMLYKDGIYKDEFIDYLSQVYSPIDRVRYKPDSLEKLTEVPFSILDQQYKSYLESLETQ
nr:hypothetical protein [Planctomicrobium sp.]